MGMRIGELCPAVGSNHCFLCTLSCVFVRSKATKLRGMFKRAVVHSKFFSSKAAKPSARVADARSKGLTAGQEQQSYDQSSKFSMVLGVVLGAGLLLYFKYMNFFIG